MTTKPKAWSLKAFAQYFNTTEDEVYTVSTALTRVMHAHPLPGHAFRTKAERAALDGFLRAHLHELPACVADAGENEMRMEALGGLFRRIKSQGMVYLLRDDGEGKAVRAQARKRAAAAGAAGGGGGSAGKGKKKTAGSGPAGGDAVKERKGEDVIEKDNGIQEDDDKDKDKDRASGEHVVDNTTTTTTNKGDSSGSSEEGSETGSNSPRSSSSEEDESEPERPSTTTTKNASTITSTSEPPPKRQKPSPQPTTLTPLHTLLLTGNIWVLNEPNPRAHGLCAIQELLAPAPTPAEQKDSPPPSLLTRLDFERWIGTVMEQCGYDGSVHRLEYRAPASVGSFARGREVCVPMLTGRQWRGALNAHVSARAEGDPVFYLVDDNDDGSGRAAVQKQLEEGILGNGQEIGVASGFGDAEGNGAVLDGWV